VQPASRATVSASAGKAKVGVRGTNLLDHRYYRPGSVLIPYRAEGLRLTGRIYYLVVLSGRSS
jgi:hypothetical protein